LSIHQAPFWVCKLEIISTIFPPSSPLAAPVSALNTRLNDRVEDHFRQWIERELPSSVRHCLRPAIHSVSQSVDARQGSHSTFSPRENGQLPSTSKRSREFSAGRAGAHGLLESWGETEQVGVADDRSPIWPSGYVGSISHSDQWVWASVAQRSSIRSIGVDTETVVDSQTRNEIQREIATLEEWAIARALNLDPETTFTILFSAKESFYKCWYPETQNYFEFCHAGLVSCEGSRLRIGSLKSNPNFDRQPATLDVSFTVIENQVFTAAWMEHRNEC
jgi:4'-phosphopantetheinyl transferase EntD